MTDWKTKAARALCDLRDALSEGGVRQGEVRLWTVSRESRRKDGEITGVLLALHRVDAALIESGDADD